jgi:hypothetical protein
VRPDEAGPAGEEHEHDGMLAYVARMRRALLLPLACLAFVACGDDDSIDPEADEERIEDALLELDDLPDGFEEAEADDDDDENECNEEVLGIDADEIEDSQTAETDQAHFALGEETDVRAEITAFRDTELAEQVLEALGDDEYLACLADSLGDELPETAEIEDLDEIDSPVGGRAVEASILFSDGGQELEVVTQQHAVLVDRFGIALVVTQLGGAPDEGLVEDALEAMVERLEAGD